MDSEKQSEVRGPKPGAVEAKSRRVRHVVICAIDPGPRTVLLAALLLVAWAARADDGRKPTLESIGNEVQCTCGCVAPLNQCPHLDCAQKAQMQAFIKAEIAAGKGETTILQDLALQYGVQVLASPPAKGFNLAVWIVPSVGLLVGLGIVLVVVRRWKRKSADVKGPQSASADPKVLTAVEEEMKSTGLQS